ncbi:hypothetical protein [Lamprocystis purpurea]|jgi:hypothetical protein|uniref:hypothetical protein n=1 Tax=Lamprocystis purpurea TaxID=61598 RepID=UPI00039D41C3|nr:hypothetical protein [Lamprocystis purpurea]
MTSRSLKETIRRELPEIVRTDPDFLRYILDLTRREYAGRAATEDRFYEILAELRRDREESARKWDEYKEEQNRKWDAHQLDRDLADDRCPGAPGGGAPGDRDLRRLAGGGNVMRGLDERVTSAMPATDRVGR